MYTFKRLLKQNENNHLIMYLQNIRDDDVADSSLAC